MDGDPRLEKTALRRWARREAPPAPDESEAVVIGLTHWIRAQHPSTILVYLSMPGELPADRVVDGSIGDHRFLVTRTPATGPLTIHRFSAPRESHPFGYRQPVAEAPEIDPSEVDIVLAPGLCFDRHGGRLGWGKGYYDRLLAEMSPTTSTVGVTLERFVVPRLPTEPHDRFMSHLATENGVRPVVAEGHVGR